MQTYTVFGFYEHNEQQTYVDAIEAHSEGHAGVIASRFGVSIVAILPGDHTADVIQPEFAANLCAYNGSDGADDLTPADEEIL